MAQIVPIRSITATNTAVNVGVTDTSILAANTARKGFVVTNDGTVNVYISLGATAVAGQGIRLNAGGGAFQGDINSLWQGSVRGIAVGGTCAVTVCELL